MTHFDDYIFENGYELGWNKRFNFKDCETFENFENFLHGIFLATQFQVLY